jgi:hypothetical protein
MFRKKQPCSHRSMKFLPNLMPAKAFLLQVSVRTVLNGRRIQKNDGLHFLSRRNLDAGGSLARRLACQAEALA